MKNLVPKNYVERELEKKIEKYLSRKEILAVLGARQCGKTTMINAILEKQEGQGKKINKISFENQIVLNLFETDLENFIEKHIKGFDILFIDEVQYSKKSGKNLKYIYDSFDIKIILTGSSAIDISLNSIKYLVGRIFLFYLYPFSFSEFLKAKDEKIFNIYSKGKYGTEILNELNKYLDEFIVFGGYPEVVLAKDKEDKRKILQDIFSALLLREVKDLAGLSENQKLVSFFKSLSLQTGNLVDYTELSKITGLDINQIKKIFKVLEESFICKRLAPFSRNKRTELYKNPKIYFLDNGLRNASLDSFSFVDFGQLYENFIFSELVKKDKKIFFWRTKSKAEVDFVLEENLDLSPIEIKSKLVDTSLTRSYSSFLEKYSPKEGFFLSRDFRGKRVESKTEIIFDSFLDFLRSI